MSSRRPFAALAVAEAFSISGTRLSQIAVPWLVLTMTGSPVWTGVVGFAEMLPYVVAKALGGPIVDRIGAKTVAVTADSCSVLIVGLIPLLHWIGALQLVWLVPIAALMGAVRGPSDGAKSALVPAVAEHGDIPLERITGVMGAIERLGGTVGAAAAGAVVAVIGAPQALLVNAVTFAVAAACLSRGVHDAKPVQPQTDRAEPSCAGSSYRRQLLEGWRFLRGDSVLVGITMMVALTNLLDQAWTAVLLPVWAHDTGRGAGAVGLVLAAMAGPSILGALTAATVGERLPRLPVYVVGFLLAGIPRFSIFAFDTPVWLMVIVLTTVGFASGFCNPILGAVLFERIPEALVGRVSALNSSLCWSLIPFGGIVGGVLSAFVGWRTATMVVGIAYFLVTLMPLVRKSFREFNKHSTGDPVAGEELKVERSRRTAVV